MKKKLIKTLAIATALSTVASLTTAVSAFSDENISVTDLNMDMIDVYLSEDTSSGVELFNFTSATYTGYEIRPKVAVYDDDSYQLVEDVDYYLTYEDNINVGTGYIVVNFIGNYEGTKKVPFTIVAKEVTEESIVIDDIESVIYTGTAYTPMPFVTVDGLNLTNGTDYDISYENNTNAGTATVIFTFKANYAGEMTANFEIEAKSLTADDISSTEIEDVIFSGDEFTPEPTISYDGKTLVNGKDYDLTYEDNTDVGTAKVIVTLKNNYSGTKEITFEISKLEITQDSLIMSEIEPQEYTKNPITPEPTVTVNEKTLEKDVDYTLSYENNTNAGTATVKVTGIGNYSGEYTSQFTVNPKNADFFIVVILDDWQ